MVVVAVNMEPGVDIKETKLQRFLPGEKQLHRVTEGTLTWLNPSHTCLYLEEEVVILVA